MDLSMSSSIPKEDPFTTADSLFSGQDLPLVPNDYPESYCRLCLTTPDVVPLIPTAGSNHPTINNAGLILDLIGQYIGIGLSPEEDTPCSVCNSCQMILDQFDLFRQNCLKVDIAIRRKRLGLDRVVVKSEPQEEDDEEEVELPYIRLENRLYQCRICKERFRSMQQFMTHCKEEHPDEAKMYKCKHCDKSFMSKTARLQHIRSHRPSNTEIDYGGLRVQVCERCMTTFDSYKLLKTHIKEAHSKDPKTDTLVCNTCSRQFSRITILRNHILRVHMGKQPHVCRQCGDSFGYAQQLVSHLKLVHGITPDQYGLFPEDDAEPEDALNPPSESQAAAGLLIPKEEPQDLPPAGSASEPPTPDRPLNKYSCMECPVKCYSQEALRSHKKIHQDPIWWKCTHCRNFVKHREMHLQKKHTTIDAAQDLESSFMMRYRCWMCRMYFKSLQQMEVHAHIKHQVPLPDDHPRVAPSDELEEGEIRPDVPMGAPSTAVAPGLPMIPALPTTLPGMPVQPLTVQPPALPINPEHFPLLLSQLENGAMDYLREFTRLIDPTNQLGLAGLGQLNIKSEPINTSQSIMDLSGGSALNMTVASSASATDLYHSTRGGDTTAMEPDDDLDGADDDDESEDDTFYKLDNRTYQCKFCPEMTRHLLEIRKHTKMQHPSQWKSFKCVHCKRRFPSGPMRDRHAHFHSLNHPFKCRDCDQMYRSKKRMDKHFGMYHETRSPNFSVERFQCVTCRLSFVEKKYYDAHSRIYHDRKPQRLKNLSEKIQVCERCVKRFDSRDHLYEHIREAHQGDGRLKTPICQVCSKDMKTMTLLRIHILVVHMGILPFVCQHCNSKFASRHWLLKHMEKNHAEIAMCKCPCCDESFTTEARMIEHKDKFHAMELSQSVKVEFDPATGKTAFPCGKCDKKLENQELLDKHLMKAHPSFMLMYKCPMCTQSVRYRKQHMRVHHDMEYDEKEHKYQVRYKCHCCTKFFQQKRNLLAHQNSLANQCGRCSMRFKTKKGLSLHLATHRGKSLQCEDCGLDFGYRGRLEEHRKRYHSANSTQVLKIINCPYCPKLFISPSNRERHIASSHNIKTEFEVHCNHCPMQASGTGQLRDHYKVEHPEERVTYKCPGCERFYLNLSSFKDHYKKHRQEEEEKAKMGSTSEAVKVGETNQVGGEVLESAIKVEDVQTDGAVTEIRDTTLNGESSADGLKIKQEPLNDGEAAILKDLSTEKESMMEEGSSEQKSAVVKVEAATSENLSGGEKPVVEVAPGEHTSEDQKVNVEAATVGDAAGGEKSIVAEASSEHTAEDQKVQGEVATAEGKPIEGTGEAKSTAKDIGEAATPKDMPEGAKSMAAEAPSVPKPTAIEEQRPHLVETKEEPDKSSAEPMATENPVGSGANVEESTEKEKPSEQEANEIKVEKKVVSERTIDKPAEDHVAREDKEEQMAVDEPTAEDKMEVEETVQPSTKQSPATVEKPQQDIPQINASTVDGKSTVEQSKSDEPMEVDEDKPCQSTSEEKQPKKALPDQDVSMVENELPEKEKTTEEKLESESSSKNESPEKEEPAVEKATADQQQSEAATAQEEKPLTEEKIDKIPAEEVKPKQDTATDAQPSEEQPPPAQANEEQSSKPAPAAEEPVAIDEKPTNKSANEVKTEQETSSAIEESPENLKVEPPTVAEELVAVEKENTSKSKEPVTAEEKTTSKSEEEVKLEQQTTSESKSPEEQKSVVKEPKPNESTTVEEASTENLKSESGTDQQLSRPEQKTTVEKTTKPEDVPVNKSEAADVKPLQEIVVENVDLSLNPTLSDAPQVESSSSKKENKECVVALDKIDLEGDKNDVQQDEANKEEKSNETVEDPPASSKVNEKAEEASTPEQSESKQEDEGCKVNKTTSNDVAHASEKSDSPGQEQESPAAAEKLREEAPDNPGPSVQNNKDDPSPDDDLRSANDSPTSTLAESPYTIVETSNEASEVSESSAVSDRSSKRTKAGDKRRISTRNVLKKKPKLVVLLEPIDMDKLAELSRGSSASSSPSLERVAIKNSGGGSGSESQPSEDGFRPKRLRRDRRTPNSDTVAGDSTAHRHRCGRLPFRVPAAFSIEDGFQVKRMRYDRQNTRTRTPSKGVCK